MTIVIHLRQSDNKSLLLEVDQETDPKIVRNILRERDHESAVTELLKICCRVKALRDIEMPRAERFADFTVGADFVTERLA